MSETPPPVHQPIPGRAAARPRPLVSVIITGPGCDSASLASALAQTHELLELLFVAGPGREHPPLHDPRMRCLECSGPTRAALRNAGLGAARGEYICYLDGGDLWDHGHVERLVAALERGGARVAHTDAAHGRQIPGGRLERAPLFEGPVGLERLLQDSAIALGALMHARACSEQIGTFDQALAQCEDWDLCIRLARAFELLHVPGASCTVTRTAALAASGDAHRLRQALLDECYLRTKHRVLVAERGLIDSIYPRFSARVGQLIDRGHHRVAVEALSTWVEQHPADGAARLDLGFLSSLMGAVEDGARVLLRPGMPAVDDAEIEPHRRCAEELVRRAELDKAQLLQESLLAQRPADPEGLNNLGVIAWLRGRRVKARALLDLSLAVDPRCTEAHKNLGHMALQDGLLQQALDHFSAAHRCDPGDAEALRMCALLECRVKEQPGSSGGDQTASVW